MLVVGGQTEVRERRSCLVSRSKMRLSFRRLVVIKEMAGQGEVSVAGLREAHERIFVRAIVIVGQRADQR